MEFIIMTIATKSDMAKAEAKSIASLISGAGMDIFEVI